MTEIYIPRALTIGDEALTEQQLLRRGGVIVVLAEPGAGKSALLKSLSSALQTTPIKATVFRNRKSNTFIGPLVVDAMDEVARIDKSATDQIIAKASETHATSVIFAGRSSEWDERLTRYVEECFGQKPSIVRLEAFTEAEQRQLFASVFPGESFDAFVEEVTKLELAPLLGNPQFLQLLGEAYIESGRVFTSKAKIFADAVRRLAHEANPDLGRQNRPPTDEIVALGDEVFAKLMLSGAAGIATVERLADRDFPYVNTLCQDPAKAGFLIDTRLLKPSGDTERHEPVHRIVAEYAAAAYLAKRIEDPSDRLSLKRVMSIVAPNGVTRRELRGMLGWMAALGREPLQMAAIDIDPYAVLANGDPGQLTAHSKSRLLKALENLADLDPLFRRSDLWRRFNVGQFFSAKTLVDVRTILAKGGTLRDLILELLIGTEAAHGLIDDLKAIVNDATAVAHTRILALEVLLDELRYDPAADHHALLLEGTPTGFELAARIVTRRGVDVIGVAEVGDLLDGLASIYPPPNTRHRNIGSRYFIRLLVKSLSLAEVTTFLGRLASTLACTCKPRYEALCTCRYGKSKIIGYLLDRYFELTQAAPDIDQLWSWLKPLHFQRHIRSAHSESVRYLEGNIDLRRSLQLLALAGTISDEDAQERLMRLYSEHTHGGLRLHDGDTDFIGQHAFETGDVRVWAALLRVHDVYGNRKGPDPIRRIQREQSQSSKQFLAAWWRREKARRDYVRSERKHLNNRYAKRFEKREAITKEHNRAHLRANRAQIEAGEHWGWLRDFAQIYLFEPDKMVDLVDDPETPLRALRNCFPFLNAHVPSLETLAQREWTAVAEVLLAACLVRFRDGEDLSGIDPRILEAAKTEASTYPTLTEDEAERFESAIDEALFRSAGDAERFLRRYIETQLGLLENGPTSIYWLDSKKSFQGLRASLPLEWLERFTSMTFENARSLFAMAARYGDRKQLVELIDRRLNDPFVDSGEDTEADRSARSRRVFWQLNAFLYNTPGAAAAWEELKLDPQNLLSLSYRLDRIYSDDDGGAPPLQAEQVFKILDAYVEVWPRVPLPSSWGSGDPPGETAYRFLRDLIWRIAADAPARRIEVLDRILADTRFADYREPALNLRSEAVRDMALQDFRAPQPNEITSMLVNQGVASVEDLRALMVEELEEVQKWIDGAETDPIDSFYSGGKRVDENTARNRIVDQLNGRMKALGLPVVIERHMAGGNRCDITASATIEGMNRLLVTEVKGQWNNELFTAAAAQLDQRYAIHSDAARQGVYLVLWYGNGERVAGLVDSTVASAADLKRRIISSMTEELRVRIDVVVLDLSKNPTTPRAHNSRRKRKTASKKAASSSDAETGT